MPAVCTARALTPRAAAGPCRHRPANGRLLPLRKPLPASRVAAFDLRRPASGSSAASRARGGRATSTSTTTTRATPPDADGPEANAYDDDDADVAADAADADDNADDALAPRAGTTREGSEDDDPFDYLSSADPPNDPAKSKSSAASPSPTPAAEPAPSLAPPTPSPAPAPEAAEAAARDAALPPTPPPTPNPPPSTRPPPPPYDGAQFDVRGDAVFGDTYANYPGYEGVYVDNTNEENDRRGIVAPSPEQLLAAAAAAPAPALSPDEKMAAAALELRRVLYTSSHTTAFAW